jgi:hypothetical protein
MSVWMNFLARSSFRRTRTVITNQSPFNGATYRSGMQDDRWVFRFDYVPMTRREAGPLLAAIAAQRGGTGTMQVYDPDFQKPIGNGGFIGAVNGAGQTGLTLNTDGWPASILLAGAGSKMWLNDFSGTVRMYELTADAMTNGAGQCAIPLDVPILGSPPDNAQVGFGWGFTGIYMLARLTGFDKQTGDDGLFRISVAGEEII